MLIDDTELPLMPEFLELPPPFEPAQSSDFQGTAELMLQSIDSLGNVQ